MSEPETVLTWQAVVTIVSQALIAAAVTCVLAWINRKSAGEAKEAAQAAAVKVDKVEQTLAEARKTLRSSTETTEQQLEIVRKDLKMNTDSTIATEKKVEDLKQATARWQTLLESPPTGEGK